MGDANFGIQIEGLDALMSKLNALSSKAPEAMAKALYKEAEDIMGKSKALVPVDTGALRSSGHVELPEVEEHKVSVTLGYGGTAAKYASPVHENLCAHHPTGQAKYLEQPANEAKSGMADRLAVTAREELGI